MGRSAHFAGTVRAVVIRRMLIVATALVAVWAAPAKASTWCGTPSTTDRVPNVLAGNVVHVIYASPADGPDRLAQFATQMQTDAEQIDAWWRREDPIRTPRFDLFPFSCGSQLDIVSLRLPQAGAQFADIRVGANILVQELERGSLNSPFGKDLVYYDGPINEQRLCGFAEENRGGFSAAVVLLNSCTGVPSVTVAAHELIHSFGAVPDGAPHNCPPPDDGHTCDNRQDILYPFADGSSLDALLLDPGRDDYYGHSGSWFDVQDSPWLVALDRQVQLALTIQGQGAVVSETPGVNCSASCTSSWNGGTQVALHATASPGSRFIRWTGACTGSGPCFVNLAQSASVTAVFGAPTFKLNVQVSGNGRVRAVPAGFVCATRCSLSVPSFEPETLRATPTKGWRLKAWTGACTGAKPVCSVPMTADASARAVFVKVPKKKK